jgi:hypothetical protein
MLNRRVLLGGLAAVPLAVPATRAATTPALATSGSELLSGNSQVRLRGVAIGDPFDARRWRPGSDMTYLSDSWNANVARLSVQSVSWRDHPDQLLAALDRDVQAALAARMWVIICWHVIGWPDGRVESDWYDSSWPLCVDFWTAMRDRYGQDGRVVFELWNEPLSDTAWGEPNATTWPQLALRYEQLLELIRQRSSNLCLCAGDWNSHDLRGIRARPVRGTNVGYVWHCYPIDKVGDPKTWDTLLDGLPAVAPVVVTEWGFDPAATSEHYHGTAATFGDKLVPYLDAHGLHWTAWCWHPEWGPSMLKSDWRSTTTFGAYVMAALGQGAQPRPVASAS